MLPSYFLLVALAGADPTVPAEFETCRSETLEVLEEAGVPPADVRRIDSVPRRTFSVQSDRITGHDSWTRIAGCSGQVVVEFTRTCRPLRLYSTGDCAIPR